MKFKIISHIDLDGDEFYFLYAIHKDGAKELPREISWKKIDPLQIAKEKSREKAISQLKVIAENYFKEDKLIDDFTLE